MYRKTPNSAVNWDRENTTLSENHTVRVLSQVSLRRLLVLEIRDVKRGDVMQGTVYVVQEGLV